MCTDRFVITESSVTVSLDGPRHTAVSNIQTCLLVSHRRVCLLKIEIEIHIILLIAVCLVCRKNYDNHQYLSISRSHATVGSRIWDLDLL